MKLFSLPAVLPRIETAETPVPLYVPLPLFIMAEADGTYKLKQLERERADEGQLQDIARSDALATDQAELDSGYWMKPATIGAIFSIGMGTTSSYWGFTPPAGIITYINADIGMCLWSKFLQVLAYANIFKGPSDNSSLFSIVWSMCCAISILLFGRVSDKFGRRWFVVGASIMGFIGGIIACTAKDMNTLVGANVSSLGQRYDRILTSDRFFLVFPVVFTPATVSLWERSAPISTSSSELPSVSCLPFCPLDLVHTSVSCQMQEKDTAKSNDYIRSGTCGKRQLEMVLLHLLDPYGLHHHPSIRLLPPT